MNYKHKHKLILNGHICLIELHTILHGNEAWVNAINPSGETPLHILARSRNFILMRLMLPFYTDIETINKQGNTISHILVDHKVEWLPHNVIQRIDMLRLLISFGADINRCNNSGWNLVHFASKHCNIEMLKFLERSNADFLLQTVSDGTALLIACKYMQEDNEEVKTIDFLLNMGCNVNVTDEDDCSALHYAAEKCSSTTVIKLLKRGSDVNLRTKEHKLTPLHFAVRRKHNLAIVEILLNAGAIIESPEIDELTPLHISILEGSADVIEYLIKNGADVNCLEKNLQFTPLHLAICQQRPDLFKLLIDNGADVNCSGEDGLTPLHFASMIGCSHFTQTLISFGARLNCNYNNHSLRKNSLAVKIYNPENVRCDKKRSLISKLLKFPRDVRHFGNRIDILLFNEANPNILTTSGWNLLHFAARWGRNTNNFLKMMYEHGSNNHYQGSDFGLTALHLASANNFQNVVNILVDSGADVNALSQTGHRPIHLALRLDCTDVLKILAKSNVTVDCKEIHSKLTPLHLALYKNYKEAAEILIEAGADVNCLTPDCKSPMYLALEFNCVEVLNSMILRGANVNYKEPHSQLSLLHVALLKNLKDAAEILINSGADVNSLTKEGKSPLHLELESHIKIHHDEFTKILQLLVKYGANVNYPEPQSKLMPLHISLYKKYERSAVILINSGADVKILTPDGKSSLNLAIENNCVEALEPLITHGANVNFKEPNSKLAPLHVALLKNLKEATKILIKFGADVNALTENGLRPIHLALFPNCTELLKLLLEKGAYVDGKDIQLQLTPLHLALYKDYRDAAEILINSGADVSALTIDGKSSLHLALESNNTEILRILIEKGANLNCKGKRCLYTLCYITANKNDEDIIDETDNLEKSLLFRAVNTHGNREIKKAVFRLSALIDAFNETSCMSKNLGVDKCCIESSACLRVLGIDSNDFEAYSKFITYRVLSGTFHEWNNRYIMNENNVEYLSNYLSMINNVKLPLTCNNQGVNKLLYTSEFFSKEDKRIYDEKCLDEIEKMQNYFISDGITLYDVIHMRSKYRRVYMKNLDLFEIRYKFEIYYKLILTYYYEYQIRKILMKTVRLAILRLTNKRLLIPLIKNIFMDLNVVDMIATIEAAEKFD